MNKLNIFTHNLISSSVPEALLIYHISSSSSSSSCYIQLTVSVMTSELGVQRKGHEASHWRSFCMQLRSCGCRPSSHKLSGLSTRLRPAHRTSSSG
uniref:Uncharacterized protein n=1 Tax=Arundo donax TaxID=35708 RepID=A0A0A9C851_ARUDO